MPHLDVSKYTHTQTERELVCLITASLTPLDTFIISGVSAALTAYVEKYETSCSALKPTASVSFTEMKDKCIHHTMKGCGAIVTGPIKSEEHNDNVH